MCIRDRVNQVTLSDSQQVRLFPDKGFLRVRKDRNMQMDGTCLLYTSDAADERSSVDLGGRRIIKKKKRGTHSNGLNIAQENSKKYRSKLKAQYERK